MRKASFPPGCELQTSSPSSEELLPVQAGRALLGEMQQHPHPQCEVSNEVALPDTWQSSSVTYSATSDAAQVEPQRSLGITRRAQPEI